MQVLVEGPSSNPELATRRQPLRLSRALLSPLVVEGLERGVRHATLKQRWEKSEIDSKWEQTNWAKKREQKSRRDNLTDFERFKVLSQGMGSAPELFCWKARRRKGRPSFCRASADRS